MLTVEVGDFEAVDDVAAPDEAAESTEPETCESSDNETRPSLELSLSKSDPLDRETDVTVTSAAVCQVPRVQMVDEVPQAQSASKDLLAQRDQRVLQVSQALQVFLVTLVQPAAEVHEVLTASQAETVSTVNPADQALEERTAVTARRAHKVPQVIPVQTV